MPRPLSRLFSRPLSLRGLLSAARLPVAASAVLLSATMASQPAMASEELNIKTVEAIVEKLLEKKPEIVIKAIEAYRDREEKAAKLMQQEAIKTISARIAENDAIPTGGNPKGDVTIFEFFDYNCGYCKKVAEDVLETAKKDGNTRVKFIEFPILSESSFTAAKAALASERQGKYIDFHMALMSLEGKITEPQIMAAAEKIGLDVAQLKKDMEDKAIADSLKENVEMARMVGVTGTPAFIIGNHFLPGAIKQSMMQDLVTAARQ